MSTAVKVHARVKVETRLYILGTAISEFASAFGAERACLTSIQKGVIDQQIIKEIQLHYYSRKEHVGVVTMHVDWERHQVLAHSDGGDRFEVRSDRPLLEQLDAASKEIIAHVDRIRKQCKVTKIRSFFIYREEYQNDPQKDKEARKYLGHVLVTENIHKESSDEFKTLTHYEMGKLKELAIDIEH